MRNIVFLFFLMSQYGMAQLPRELVSERSLVLYDLPSVKSGDFEVRGDWQTTASDIQSSLRIVGVDAIAYLHFDDWNASPAHRESYRLFFATRGVTNVLKFSKEGNIYTLEVLDLQTVKRVWNTNGGSLNQLVFRLGKEIKRLGHAIENFVVPETAEIFTDIPFSRWNASMSFPGRVRDQKIGVAKFDDPAMNEELLRVMEMYPYRFDLIDYTGDDDAFRDGYQYVLLNMTTAGESIKKLLNYKMETYETAYVSTVKGDSTDTRTRTIPADAIVTKFYFRHTVNKEIYVGGNWDADVTWTRALENYLLLLRKALKK